MPTIKEAVHAAIDQDVFLQEAFGRDILNRRAVARWLMKYRGIEGSFETVYDAVEGYEPPDVGVQRIPSLATEDLRIHQTRYVHALLVERSEASFRRLAGLFDDGVVEYQNTHRIIPSRGRVLVVVDSASRDAVVDALGAEVVTGEVADLFQIAIQPKHLPQAGSVPVASLILALRNRGIQVPYVASGATEQFLLVPRESEGAALDVIASLLVDPSL